MMSRCYVAQASIQAPVITGSTTQRKVRNGRENSENAFTKDDLVEIYLLQLDCQVCGSEINPDREEYIGRTRVCPRCYDELTQGNDRKARQRKNKKRGGLNGY